MTKHILDGLIIFIKKEKKIAFSIFFLLFLIFTIPHLIENYLIEIPKRGGIVNEIIIGSKVRFINPVIAISKAEKDLLPIIYSPILKRDAYGNIISGVAHVELEGSKTYNIFIKDNIQFSDGQKLTTDDIIFTIKQIQNPLIKSPLNSEFIGVEYEKINDTKMKLILKNEYPQFLNTLANLYVLPKKPWENISYSEFPFHNLNIKPIGSGPFKIKSISRDSTNGKIEKYELIKNELYYKNDKTFINGISFYFFDNLEKYEKSLIYSNKKIIKNIALLSLSDTLDIQKNNTYLDSNIQKIDSTKIFGLFLNKNNTFLKDPQIRNVISKIINREHINNEILHNAVKPLNSILFNKKYTASINNLEDTISTLKNNKYKIVDNILKKEGQDPVKLNIQTIDSTEFKDLANYIKRQLLQIGIESEVITYTENDFLDSAVRGRNFDILLFGYKINTIPDFFHLFHSSQMQDPSLNITGIKSFKIDNLILKLRKDIPKKERSEIEQELDNEILKENLFIPLYSPYYIYLLDNRVHNFDSKLLNSSNERFNNLENWYIQTEKILPFFR